MIKPDLSPRQANWLLAVFKDLPTRGTEEAFLLVTTQQAINRAITEASAPVAPALPPGLEAAPTPSTAEDSDNPE